MPGPRIIIADDHPLVREALAHAVTRAQADAQVIHADSLATARAELDAGARPALVLLDLQMTDSKGLAGLLLLRGLYPDTPVAVVSACEDASVMRRALNCGARAYIPKSTPLAEMSEALRSALDGVVWSPATPEPTAEAQDEAAPSDPATRLARLTPAQLRVLVGLMEGRLNKQIAYDMNISEATVKAHVTAVFRKLGVRNRTQAVIAAKALEHADDPTRA